MFGYVKPDRDNLLVKDLALYKSIYCGLCASIKKNVSFTLPLTLSYDFVFLAMVRTALKQDSCTYTKGRCKYNPIKKCSFSTSENETLYTARCALILTVLKLEDDITDKDTPVYKRLLQRALHHHYSKKCRKLLCEHQELCGMYDSVKDSLNKLNELENERSSNIDRVCEIFGEAMRHMLCYGLEGNALTIAEEIGSCVGKYIYMMDAIDDLKKNEKSGAYNPILVRYGSLEEAFKHIEDLDVAVGMYAQRALLAFNLLDECEYSRIIENVLSSGMGAEAYRIMTKNGDKK